MKNIINDKCDKVIQSNFELHHAYIIEIALISLHTGYPFGLSDLVQEIHLRKVANEVFALQANDKFKLAAKILSSMTVTVFNKKSVLLIKIPDCDFKALLYIADAAFISKRFRMALLCYSLSALIRCEVDKDQVSSEIGVARCLWYGSGVESEFVSFHSLLNKHLFE